MVLLKGFSKVPQVLRAPFNINRLSLWVKVRLIVGRDRVNLFSFYLTLIELEVYVT